MGWRSGLAVPVLTPSVRSGELTGHDAAFVLRAPGTVVRVVCGGPDPGDAVRAQVRDLQQRPLPALAACDQLSDRVQHAGLGHRPRLTPVPGSAGLVSRRALGGSQPER